MAGIRPAIFICAQLRRGISLTGKGLFFSIRLLLFGGVPVTESFFVPALFGAFLVLLLICQTLICRVIVRRGSPHANAQEQAEAQDRLGANIMLTMGLAAVVGMVSALIALGDMTWWRLWWSGIMLIPLCYGAYHLAVRTTIANPNYGVVCSRNIPPTDGLSVVEHMLWYVVGGMLTVSISAAVFLISAT